MGSLVMERARQQGHQGGGRERGLLGDACALPDGGISSKQFLHVNGGLCAFAGKQSLTKHALLQEYKPDAVDCKCTQVYTPYCTWRPRCTHARSEHRGQSIAREPCISLSANMH